MSVSTIIISKHADSELYHFSNIINIIILITITENTSDYCDLFILFKSIGENVELLSVNMVVGNVRNPLFAYNNKRVGVRRQCYVRNLKQWLYY